MLTKKHLAAVSAAVVCASAAAYCLFKKNHEWDLKDTPMYQFLHRIRVNDERTPEERVNEANGHDLVPYDCFPNRNSDMIRILRRTIHDTANTDTVVLVAEEDREELYRSLCGYGFTFIPVAEDDPAKTLDVILDIVNGGALVDRIWLFIDPVDIFPEDILARFRAELHAFRVKNCIFTGSVMNMTDFTSTDAGLGICTECAGEEFCDG